MAMMGPPEYCAADGVTVVCDANHTGVDFVAREGIIRPTQSSDETACQPLGWRLQSGRIDRGKP